MMVKVIEVILSIIAVTCMFGIILIEMISALLS